MVSLSVVEALQPVRPSAIDLSEIGGAAQHRPARRASPGAAGTRSRVAERWVRERQEADGSWGGIQPPWVWSLIMLAALGHGFEDETLRARARRLGTVPRARRRPPAARGLPVADLGHRALGARPARGRRPGRRSAAPGCRLVAARRGGDGPRRLGDPPARPRTGRLVVRVRQRPLSRRRRHGRGRARAPRARARRRGRPARARLDGRDAVARAAAGVRSMPTTRRCGSTSSRSATSARSPTSRPPT